MSPLGSHTRSAEKRDESNVNMSAIFFTQRSQLCLKKKYC